jgi:uncharacterized protein YecT (DUF1311 family)
MRLSSAHSLWLVGLAILFAGRLHAQHMNAQESPSKSPASNADTRACFLQASKAADEPLNKTYGRIREVLSPREQTDLQTAQRLWLKFREANCSAERNLYAGGSGAPTAYDACIEASRQRASDFETMYSWRLEKFGKAE